MRLLIFLFALLSAFFVSYSHSVEYIDSDYVGAESKMEFVNNCYLSRDLVGPMGKDACKALAKSEKPSSEYYGWTQHDIGGGRTAWIAYCDCGWNNRKISYVSAHHFTSTEILSDDLFCPPTASPTHKIGPIHKPGEDTTQEPRWCLPNTPNRCPPATDNDPFVFGTGSQKTDKCFKNDDGTQCKITTDENGGYYIPISYGSAEPVQCSREPDKEVDKTPTPDDKPTPEETDDGAQMTELDALNKINENLDAMNENQLNASDSNDERLDRVSEEIQIGNEVLGEIRFNTDSIESNTDDTNVLLGETNSLLGEILDNTGGGTDGEPCTGDDCEETPTDDFSISGTRKLGGLNDVFTDEDLALVTKDIEDKQTEFTDYIDTIKSESETILDINPNISGGYEDRKTTIKGVEVDLGVSRFSDFFKLIAPAIMLVSSMTALFVLLGDRK